MIFLRLNVYRNKVEETICGNKSVKSFLEMKRWVTAKIQTLSIVYLKESDNVNTGEVIGRESCFIEQHKHHCQLNTNTQHTNCNANNI